MKANLLFISVVAAVALIEASLAGPLRAQMVAESPFTLVPGGTSVEFVLFDYARDREDGVDVEAWTLFDALLVFGVRDAVDFQIAFTTYAKERVRYDDGFVESADGSGAVQLRSAVNLWGNETGSTALGLLPFVQLPTGATFSSDALEGGLIAAFSWHPGDVWRLALHGEVDAAYDSVEDRHAPAYLHATAFSCYVAGPWGFYLEHVGFLDPEPDARYGSLGNAGLTLDAGEDMMLYAGSRIALNDVPGDRRNYVGIIAWY